MQERNQSILTKKEPVLNNSGENTMLIQSTLPKSGSAAQRPSRGQALAKKMSNQEVAIEDLYKDGSWKFEDRGGETYHLNRQNAVGFMQRSGAARATFKVWGAKGEYDSLSAEDQQKRKTEARSEAIAKGAATSIFTGMLMAGGSAVLGVLDSVGSLLTRSGGGGGIGLGLGALGAIAGVTGLVVGISSYRSGLQRPVSEIVQTGFAKKQGQGFRFEPSENSPDTRPVLVKNDSVSEAKVV
jgi:hypothetical protein